MNVRAIDLRFQGVPGIIAAYVIESAGELALVETGPGATLAQCLAGLKALDIDPKALRKVFVTHIHLDHAGAAGWWAQQGAMVFCHPAAERHLVDPSKLMDSARMIYGAEGLQRLWGEMLPAPAENVRALADGESVAVGAVRLTAWDTPGHARHHHAYHAAGVCFTGDVAGVRLEGNRYTSVAAAPPQFDAEAYVASVRRLQGGGFARLYLTHFGGIDDVEPHLESYAAHVGQVRDRVASWLKQSPAPSAGEIQNLYREAEHAQAIEAGTCAADWERYELANSCAMCADGVRLSIERAGR